MRVNNFNGHQPLKTRQPGQTPGKHTGHATMGNGINDLIPANTQGEREIYSGIFEFDDLLLLAVVFFETLLREPVCVLLILQSYIIIRTYDTLLCCRSQIGLSELTRNSSKFLEILPRNSFTDIHYSSTVKHIISHGMLFRQAESAPAPNQHQTPSTKRSESPAPNARHQTPGTKRPAPNARSDFFRPAPNGRSDFFLSRHQTPGTKRSK